jgi:hypothetical protein
MSRRARTRLLVRELKHADAYLGPDPTEDDEGSHPDAWADEAREDDAQQKDDARE